MRNQFILAIGSIGLLMVSCLPARAQTFANQIFLARSPSEPMMLFRLPPPRYSSPTLLLTINKPPKFPGHVTRISTATYAPGPSLESRFSIVEDRTPFVTESRVPVARFWGGRLQLEGFDTTCRRYPQLSGMAHDYPPPTHDQAGMHRSFDIQGISLQFNLEKPKARWWAGPR